MPQFVDAETGDGATRYVGHARSEHKRVYESAHDYVAAEFRLAFGPVPIHVQRTRRHREHAKHVILGLGNGPAWPVLVNVARLVVLEVAAKAPFARGEDAPHISSLS